MNKIQAYILHKENEKFNSCDDNFSFNAEKLNFAVCDGSSSDFFSKIYSRVLSDKYSEIGGDMFSAAIISELNNQWREQVKEEIEEAGCRPGSFPFVHYQRRDPGCSTFICLSFHNDNTKPTFDFYALGDSMAFFIPKGEYIPEIQISSDSNDDFSFNPNIHFGYTPPIASSYSTKWLDLMKKGTGRQLKEGSFIMVTDAIAEWLLRNDGVSKEEKFKEILAIDSQKKFTSYVKEIRDKGAHMDDMTLVIISIDDIHELQFSQENIDKYDYRTIVQKQSNKLKPQEPTVEPHELEVVHKEPVVDLQEQVDNLQEQVKELNTIINQLQKEKEELQKTLNEKKKDLQTGKPSTAEAKKQTEKNISKQRIINYVCWVLMLISLIANVFFCLWT